MHPTFAQLNFGWNAEPNAPDPEVRVAGSDIVLEFFLNAFQFPAFKEGQRGSLYFKSCERYRLGSTNDEGWYMGQCRFSKLAPAWGEFYKIDGEQSLLLAPTDWVILGPPSNTAQHFLFYLRDETFECVAEDCEVELPANNSFKRTCLRHAA
jgi:hypothetical protein